MWIYSIVGAMAVHMFTVARSVSVEQRTEIAVIRGRSMWAHISIELKDRLAVACSNFARSLYPKEIKALSVDIDDVTRKLIVTFGSSTLYTPAEISEIDDAFDKWFITGGPDESQWRTRLTLLDWLVVDTRTN